MMAMIAPPWLTMVPADRTTPCHGTSTQSGYCRRLHKPQASGPGERAVLDDGPKSAELGLLCQLRSGERQATEGLVREHAVWMLALAQRYVKDRALAEDCVQEAFLQVFRSIREFEGRSAVKSWLIASSSTRR